MQELSKIITKFNADVVKLKNSSINIEEEIKVLQAKILEVGGVRLRAQKAKVDGINEQNDSIHERIMKLQVEKSTREKSLVKAVKIIEKKETEISDSARELGKLEEEMKAKLMVAVDVRSKLDAAVHLMETKKDEMEEIKKKLDEKESMVNTIRRVEVSSFISCERV